MENIQSSMRLVSNMDNNQFVKKTNKTKHWNAGFMLRPGIANFHEEGSWGDPNIRRAQCTCKHGLDSFCERVLFLAVEFFVQLPNQPPGLEILVSACRQVWASPRSPHGDDVSEAMGNFPSVERSGLHQYVLICGAKAYLIFKGRKGNSLSIGKYKGIFFF